jgi:hypothetical protein
VSTRLNAHELIDLVLDDGSWRSWDVPPDRSGVTDGYRDEIPDVDTWDAVTRSRRVEQPGCVGCSGTPPRTPYP